MIVFVDLFEPAQGLKLQISFLTQVFFELVFVHLSWERITGPLVFTSEMSESIKLPMINFGGM